MSVHFRFYNDNNDVTNVTNLSIPRRWLEAKPDSVLSAMASSHWAGNAAVEDQDTISSSSSHSDTEHTNKANIVRGYDSSRPILVRPVEAIPDAWSPPITEMIYQAYDPDNNEDDDDGPVIRLVKGVELQEAFEALDYYGIGPSSIDNYLFSFDDEDLDYLTVVRANFFCKAYKSAAKFLEKLRSYEFERSVTLFMFVRRGLDFDYILGASGRPLTYWKAKDETWLEVEYCRNFVSREMKDRGFQVSLYSQYTIVSGPHIANPFDEREERGEKMWILKVTIPDSEHPRKRCRRT